MPCYLLRAGNTDKVKIGWAGSVTHRIATLQTAHWEPLTLLRTWAGGLDTECWLHRHFAAANITGEWFTFDAAMLEVEPPADLGPDVDLMSPIKARRGLASKLARGLGLSRAAVSLWDKVPAEIVVEVERLTDIPRELLRPDLYREKMETA